MPDNKKSAVINTAQEDPERKSRFEMALAGEIKHHKRMEIVVPVIVSLTSGLIFGTIGYIFSSLYAK